MVLHPKYRDFYHIAKKQDDGTFDVFYNPSGKKVISHTLWNQLEFKGNFDTYQDAYDSIEDIERHERQEALNQLKTFKQSLKDQQQS